MLLRKQTVWLLTMLAVMVVLSGYYLVKGPNQHVQNELKKQEDQLMGVEVKSKPSNQSAAGEDSKPVEGSTLAPDLGSTDELGKATPTNDVNKSTNQGTDANQPQAGAMPSSNDFFQGYKMKREAMMQQQKDEQMAIMTNENSTPQAIADAKAQHEELSTQESSTLALEELIKAKGYNDAVVYSQKNKVNVIVQAPKLSSQEVVDIIAQVKQQLHVSGNDVTVQFKP